MLERALVHVRTAIALRDCAGHDAPLAERGFLTAVAHIHEARACHAMRPGGEKPARPR